MVESRQSDSFPTVGTRHVITVFDIAFGGEGVGRVNDFVVFVPFVLPGEEAEIEIAEVKKNFARARLLNVLKASVERVNPQCRYFGDCGGCQYQHIDYATQLRLKHKQIIDLFQRIGDVETGVIDPVIPCPQPYGYRNRIMIRSQWNKRRQGLEIGFIRHDNRFVVDIEECKIAEPILNEQIREVHAKPPPKGGLKVVLRIAPEGWEVPRDSFFQTNFFLLPRLVDIVRERIRDSRVRHLLDAYCGVGFFAIELADLVESFAGIEIDQMAVKAARRNAANRRQTNGEFLGGDVAALMPKVIKTFSPSATSVIIDPPRAGCSPACLELLRETCPAQIVYVSCNPATLARDLNALRAGGVYELVKVVPLDMFPQTQHVECVADLRAKTMARPSN